MARLHDSDGVLLGGLNTADPSSLWLKTAGDQATTVKARGRMNRNYAEGEVVPGLGCDFGTFHLAAPRKPGVTVSRSRIPDCHNSVESPGDRHHCEMCGGDYCSVHAKIDAHDCQNVVIER